MSQGATNLNWVIRGARARLAGLRLGLLIIVAAMSARALVIRPTWDSSITNDPQSATIQATINTAIQFYQTRFADPILVTIKFQEITTAGLEGHSQWWYYDIPYSQYITALRRDATTTNDAAALLNLPSGQDNPVTGATTIRVKTANLRALGIFGDNSGIPGGFDGVIGLHTSQMNLSRAQATPGKYDLLSTAEHEIDEVLGLGSGLDEGAADPFPEDLFRYTFEGGRSFTTNGDDAYFSLDGTNFLARFNQRTGGDRGDWWCAGAHTPRVQDAFETSGAAPNANVELVALDVIGYNLAPEPEPIITGASISGPVLDLQATDGLATGTYYTLTSVVADRPLSQWARVATNTLATSGNFSIAITNSAGWGGATRFFALQLKP